MKLKLKKINHIFKNIVIGLMMIPVMVTGLTTILDKSTLGKLGIMGGVSAAANIIPENIVFSLSTKSGLTPTANGFRTGSSPIITSQLRNLKDINQMLTFKKYDFNDNRGYLYINGTSKNIGYNDGKLVVVEHQEGNNIFEMKSGFAPNSIVLRYYDFGDNSISADKINDQTNYAGFDNQNKNQMFYLTRISGVQPKIIDDSKKIILKDGQSYTFSNYSGLGFAATEFRDGTSPNIYSKIKNVNDKDQQFTWKQYNGELNRGYLFIKDTSKVIGNRDGFLTVTEYEENRNIFKLSTGFAPNSIILRYSDYGDSIINNSKSGRKESIGQRVNYYGYNPLDLDQLFYLDNPNKNPIFGPGSGVTPPRTETKFPSTPTTGNQPLIPTNYIFTMAAKHGWGVDGNNYKTSKTKRAFAYPRNKADPEQVIKWEPAGSMNTGYLRLNGTDLTFVALRGSGGTFLTLQKYNKTEAQRWDVKKITGVDDAYYLQDRSTKKVITINPENGYDVNVDPIIPGDERQYMQINKI